MRLSCNERLRVLVTGASGFYGAHFAKLCLDKGHEVYSIRHLSRPYDTASLLGITDKITWANGDICNSDLISKLMVVWDIQAVAHFAALSLVRVGTLITKPIFEVNVGGTVALLDAAANLATKQRLHFLQVSTDKVYGNIGDRPYTEDMILNGSSIYETSKIAAEQVCRAYRSHKLVPNLVVSRSCNIVGPGDVSWRLVPNTVRQFITNVPAKVYTHGQFVREYIHVDDAVEAQYQLLLRADEYAGQAFNIGSGHLRTQEEIINHIHSTHYPNGQIVQVEPPSHHFIEISYQQMDCTKIKQSLGWKPARSLESAISDTVDFWERNKKIAPRSLL